jgi:hypothetical protein
MGIPRYSDADAKDPRDDTSYTFNLAGALTVPGDAIVGLPGVSVAPPGLTAANMSVINNVVGYYVTGGVAGVEYMITFSFSTALFPLINRSVILPVRTR